MPQTKYSQVYSLGGTCQTAHQIGRLGLRGRSGPFDWFITPFDSVVPLLTSAFAGFMERANLEIVGTYAEKWIVRDTRYSVRSYHDFPVTPNREIDAGVYKEFDETVKRRVARFLGHLATQESILFVIHGGPPSEPAFYPLVDALTELRQGRSFHVLACGTCAPDIREPKDSHLSFRRFRKIAHFLSETDRWKGCDEEWDEVMGGTELSAER